MPYVALMSEKFWALTGHDIPYNHGSVMSTAFRCLQQGLLYILDDDGPKGFVAGLMSPCIANENVMVGCEIAFWIEPEHRGHGKALLTTIEKAAKELGVHTWSMVSLNAIDPDKVHELYTSMGYTPAERTYSKEL